MTGCSSSLVSFRDGASSADIVRMRGSRLAGGLCFVALNAQRFEKAKTVSYSLFVVYAGPTFLNIDNGRSLVLDIDGQRQELSGQGSERHRAIVSLGLVEEKAYYHDIDPDLIRRLAYAKKVEVMVLGSQDAVRRKFKVEHFRDFRKFYDYATERVASSH